MVRGELYESEQKLMLLKRTPSAVPCGLLWKPLQYDSSLRYNLLSMTRKTLAVEPPVFPNTFVMHIDVSRRLCVSIIFLVETSFPVLPYAAKKLDSYVFLENSSNVLPLKRTVDVPSFILIPTPIS